jgi:hypothetical protein
MEFEVAPDGGLIAATASQQLVSMKQREELRAAQAEAATHPPTVWGWRVRETIEIESGRSFLVNEPAELPHDSRLSVLKIEQRQRLEFLELWRDGKIIALALEQRPGARWYQLQSEICQSLPWQRLIHAHRFWEKSELRIPAKGPVYSLLFYSPDQLYPRGGGRKPKRLIWKTLVRSELARRDKAHELNFDRVLADEGYQTEVIKDVFDQMSLEAGRAKQRTPTLTSVATYIKTEGAWATVRRNAVERRKRAMTKPRI